MSEILDYKLHHDLRRYIMRLNPDEQHQLRNIRLCGQRINGNYSSVYLVASDKGNAKFVGQTHCRNPFCCPICSAKVMEQYRSKIATAIEILHNEYFGFMVSFSMPHVSFMGCREVLDIICDAWQYFRRKNYKKPSGHAFHDFNQVVPVCHHVKVCEQTHGKHGWHHHFHMIWWVKRGDERHLLEWESKLSEFWHKVCRMKTLKYWQKHSLHQNILEIDKTFDKVLDRMYAPSEAHQGIVFSKDEHGNVREVESAEYIAGWGADRELTGNYRKVASHEGHMTPYQILEAAQHDPKMRDLYLEFCLAMTQKPVHHRVDFSQTGLCKMIEAYRKEHGSESVIAQKKKLDGETQKFRIVTYFSKEQWFELLHLNNYSPVLSNILFLAAKYVHLLGDYLSSLGIEIGSIPRDYDMVEEMLSA